MSLLCFFVHFLLTSSAIYGAEAESKQKTTVSLADARILESFPHDPNAFTQGLVFAGPYLYESTGMYGQSSIRKLNATTGEIVKIVRLPHNVFAEGLAEFNDHLYQITWQNRIAYKYDLDLKLVGNFTYQTEGWGLTHDGSRLILSDGSPYLYFHSPEDFRLLGQVLVKAPQCRRMMFQCSPGETRTNMPLYYLNELEYIDGLVYANVWTSPYIVGIDPESGQVKKIIDMSDLAFRSSNPEAVPNGIAARRHENGTMEVWLTGKLWPELHRVEYPFRRKRRRIPTPPAPAPAQTI